MIRRALASALLIACCGFAAAQEQAPPQDPAAAELQKEYEAGYGAASSGDLASAQQHFERTVALAPQLAEAHNALGSVLLERGDAKSAAAQFEAALAIKPLRSASENLGLAYVQMGDSTKAIAQFSSAAAAAPLSAGAALAYAPLLVTTGRRDDAVTMLKATIAATDPSANTQLAALHDTLGSVLAQQKNWSGATAEFQAAIQLDPNSIAHYHLGAALQAAGQPEAAAPELARAMQITPEDVRIELAYGQVLNRLGRDDEAVATLRKAQATATAQHADAALALDIDYALALSLQNTTDPAAAVPLFQRVAAARPNDASALGNLGLALVQTGKAKDAVQWYERALKIAPTNATLLQGLGAAYLQQNEIADAERELRAAVAAAPDSAEIHYDLGLALKLHDDLQGATVELKKAMELNPNLIDPHITLGTLYMQQGKFDDAAAEMRLVLAAQPQNGDMWATLGSTLKQAGKNDEAVEALRKAIALRPEQPGPHTTLASILQAEGKTEEAAAERKTAGALTRVAMDRQAAMFAVNAGDLLLSKGDVDGAIGQYRSAVKSDSTYAPAHTQLALALDQKGQKAEAETERKQGEALGTRQ